MTIGSPGVSRVDWGGRTLHVFGLDSKYTTVAEHWDGSSSSVVPTPDLGTDSFGFEAVSAVSATDAWAVGSNAELLDPQHTQEALSAHWDGSSWTRMPAGRRALTSVSAYSPTVAWSADSQGRIWRWDGTSWTALAKSPVMRREFTVLSAVAARAANDVWVVGRQRSHPKALADHWNGTSWTFF